MSKPCPRCEGGRRGYGPPGGPFGCIDCHYTGQIPEETRTTVLADRNHGKDRGRYAGAPGVPVPLGLNWYSAILDDANFSEHNTLEQNFPGWLMRGFTWFHPRTPMPLLDPTNYMHRYALGSLRPQTVGRQPGVSPDYLENLSFRPILRPV